MTEPVIPEGSSLTMLNTALGAIVLMLSCILGVMWRQIGQVRAEMVEKMDDMQGRTSAEIGAVRQVVENNRIASEQRQGEILDKLSDVKVQIARLPTRDEMRGLSREPARQRRSDE